MTPPIRTRIAQFAGVVLALFAGSAVAAAVPHHEASRQRAVVVASQDARTIERARAIARRDGAEIRVVNTYADQLGVTHMLAARGYEQVMTVGVDEKIAVKPVAERYPGTRFVALD
jgi:phosphoribosylpyrophosphate synthetase